MTVATVVSSTEAQIADSVLVMGLYKFKLP